MPRCQHHGLRGESRAGAEQSFQLAACLQFVHAAERGNHLLANLITLAPALDDLQVGAPA